jgi:PKD repeat protein
MLTEKVMFEHKNKLVPTRFTFGWIAIFIAVLCMAMVLPVSAIIASQPEPAWHVNYYSANIGESLQFTSDTYGTFDSILWDFGDGTGSMSVNPTHHYDDAGIYDIRMVVENGTYSREWTWHNAIYIEEALPIPVYPSFNTNPIPSKGASPLFVQFIDDSEGAIYTAYDSWDFGDGSPTSNLRNPNHTYTATTKVENYVASRTVHYYNESMYWDSITTGVDVVVYPPGTPVVNWVDVNGLTKTTATLDDTVYFYFDTGTDGEDLMTVVDDLNSFGCRVTPYDATLKMWRGDLSTIPLLHYYEYGGDTGAYTTLNQTAVTYEYKRWVGTSAAPITFTTPGKYKVALWDVNVSNVAFLVTEKEITVGYNPYNADNFGAWVKSWGGDAMAFIFAVGIILIIMMIPYLIMRAFNPYIELIMAFLGLGIDVFAGLLPLWMIVAVVIVGAAIVFVAGGGMGKKQEGG